MDTNIKNKIDGIWQGMYNNGMSDAKTNITQITYLFFIKMLDDNQLKREANANAFGVTVSNPTFPKGIYIKDAKDEEGNLIGDISYDDLRWHNFVLFSTDKMYNIVKYGVFPFIKNLQNGSNTAFTRFMSGAKLDIPNGKILEKVIRGLNDDELNLDNKDVMGDAYEHLISELSTNKKNGQFRTPRHIISMMVELMKPKLGEKICDPAMGTAGFLVESANYIKEHYSDELLEKDNIDFFNHRSFNGYDTDPDMLRIGTMNMVLHDVSDPQILYGNSLTDENKDEQKYDLVLANPPFTGRLDANDLSKSLTDKCTSKKTELLFIIQFLRSLKIGGRCACIVPDGVLFGPSNAHKQIRKTIIEDNRLEAVISMPSGVFKPSAGVSTGILIFTKTGHGGTDKVWFYDMKADGYSLDDKRSLVNENDIPDIIERFNHLEKEVDRKRTDQSFLVAKKEIVENNYDLKFNTYKENVYKKIEYPPTNEILADIEELNKVINKNLEELKALLK